MDAQRGPAGECFAAVVTSVGCFSSMENQVLLQVPLEAVGFFTMRTGEWPLAAVTHLEIAAALSHRDCY